MNLPNAAVSAPGGNSRPTKKTYYIDYSVLARAFRRKNFSLSKKNLSLQQCASILLPIIFSTLLIIACIVAALAMLTDGFSLCNFQSDTNSERFNMNSSISVSLCLTTDCIRQAYFLTDRMNRSVSACEDFYGFACGGRGKYASSDPATKLRMDLSEKLKQKLRPNTSTLYRLLFDFFDSCMSDEYQEQLGTQPFNTLISRLGGWSLLQNAKFDPDNFKWESLEMQLNDYDVDGLFAVQIDPNTKKIQINSSQFLLTQYQRQPLDEYFIHLLVELGVDEELALLAVQEALDFESTFVDIYPTNENSQTTMPLSKLKERFTKVRWDKLVPLSGIEKDKIEVTIADEYVKLLESQLDSDKVRKIINNYMMMRLLHAIVLHLPRRYRAIRERLENRYEPRSATCFNELLQLMPVPMCAFGYQQQTQANMDDEQQIHNLVAKSKEQVGRQLRQITWIDTKTKSRMLKDLYNLRITTNMFTSGQMQSQVEALYNGNHLHPNSYFDNVLALKQISSRSSYQLLISEYNWLNLMVSQSPEINVTNKEIVFGPVSLASLFQLSDTLRTLQLRRHIFEFLFHFDALNQWKPESRSILQAKFHCFEQDLNNPNQLVYDQLALQTATDETTKNPDAEHKNGLKLPGLSDYSQRQLLYIAFAANRCNQVSDKSDAKSEIAKSINRVLRNSDHFADTFQCCIGEPMNPRNKCTIL